MPSAQHEHRVGAEFLRFEIRERKFAHGFAIGIVLLVVCQSRLPAPLGLSARAEGQAFVSPVGGHELGKVTTIPSVGLLGDDVCKFLCDRLNGLAGTLGVSGLAGALGVAECGRCFCEKMGPCPSAQKGACDGNPSGSFEVL